MIEKIITAISLIGSICGILGFLKIQKIEIKLSAKDNKRQVSNLLGLEVF